MGVEGFDELDPKLKSSKFWIQTEFLGSSIRSEPKLWETEFMKDGDIGKTDFKLSLRKILRLSDANAYQHTSDASNTNVVDNITFNQEVYNSLMDGMWIELYEEYPLLEEVETPEGEKQNRAVIRDGNPVFKTAIRGIVKVNTDQWIMNPNLNSTDLIIEHKFYFYKLKYKTIPEFFYDNHTVSFKASEVEAIDSFVASKREKLAKQEEEEKAKAVAEKIPDKKDPKKDKGGK